MTNAFFPGDHPHRRLDLLSGRHVLVSPHRAKRPWQGAEDLPALPSRLRYDADCYLCAGNLRAGGWANPDYRGVFVFPNDFTAVTADSPAPPSSSGSLLVMEPANGVARVLCFSPNHSATFPQLPPAAARSVVEEWCSQSAELGRDYPWVQIFENKGAVMGCSNPHPHGQIWATNYVPDEPATEDARQRAWFEREGRAMLLVVAEQEAASGERVVVENADWIAIVPFWASWPFETLLLPRFAAARLPDLTARQRTSLGAIVQALTTRYDNLFHTLFPYSMGWHGAPFDDRATEAWQVHAHFYPPLLRSASVRKFMVGYEMLAEAQRDLTPETAAERLRAASGVHFTSARA